MNKKIKAVSVATQPESNLGIARLYVVDAQGRLWVKYSGDDWGELELPDEPQDEEGEK